MTTNEGSGAAEEAAVSGEAYAETLGCVFKGLALKDGDMLIIDTGGRPLSWHEHEGLSRAFETLGRNGTPKVSVLVNDRGWDVTRVSLDDRVRMLEEIAAELKR